MGRRSDHTREEIRELALQAASKLVREQGFQGLSARKVARAIGYTVGSLYLVFKNLDDLILQVNARNLEAMHRAVADAGVSIVDPRQRLLAFGRAYLQFAVAHPHAWRMIFEHRMNDDEPVPEWYEKRIIRLFLLVEEPVRDIMLTDDAAVTQAAKALWSGVHGVCILYMTGKLDVVRVGSVESLLEHLIRTYLAGLEIGR
jgi:AcrR family transcriptional regulator